MSVWKDNLAKIAQRCGDQRLQRKAEEEALPVLTKLHRLRVLMVSEMLLQESLLVFKAFREKLSHFFSFISQLETV